MRKNTAKQLFAFVLGLTMLLSAGCASGPLAKLPTIATNKPSGEVTVIRISSIVGVTNSYKITLNGNEVFGIRSGQYTKFKLNEGEHYIGVKCFGGWTPTWKEDSLKFNVTPNSNSYFLISPDLSCASIKATTEAEAQEKMKDSKYVSMEQ